MTIQGQFWPSLSSWECEVILSFCKKFYKARILEKHIGLLYSECLAALPRVSPSLKRIGLISLLQKPLPNGLKSRLSWNQVLNQVWNLGFNRLSPDLCKEATLLANKMKTKAAYKTWTCFCHIFYWKAVVQYPKIEIQDSVQLELRAESLVPLIAMDGTVPIRIIKFCFNYAFYSRGIRSVLVNKFSIPFIWKAPLKQHLRKFIVLNKLILKQWQLLQPFSKSEK